jgi:uncharacterized membrane protein (DUF485 family)
MTDNVGEAGYEEHDPREHQSYDQLRATPEFTELRRRYALFVVPATLVFIVWYFLYVVLSNWAPGFMGTQVVGNINVALIFGLLQFVTTFGIAWLYARYMTRAVDPLARDLEARFSGGSR